MSEPLENHLRDACQLTLAAWAVVAGRLHGRWFVEASYRLPKVKRVALERYLAQAAAGQWVFSLLSGAEMSPLSLPEEARLGTGRLYGFPLGLDSQVILVCAKTLARRDQRTWTMVANLLRGPEAESTKDVFLPEMQAELAYDLPRALDRVLAGFVRRIEVQGAWLAIRRGDSLDITAQRNDSRLMGSTLPIESNRLLRRIHRNLSEVSCSPEEPDWASLPHAVRKSTRYWICLPLVIGHRMIGAVGLWGTQDFGPRQVNDLRELAQRVSQPVEVLVTFHELTGHLRRLAMLNDFALAVSSAQNLDQIARRVFGYMARSFHTELIAMYLPSIDGRIVREYRNREGKFSTQAASLPGHPILPLLRGKILRLTDAGPDFQPIYPTARSTLIVPLKYRSQTIGLLALESTRPDAFSESDEHLMVVIASHLAGLIEYGRLREEAEGRARNLGLIHEVVQQVIGLTDKKEVASIAADQLAQYFAYERATVLLAGIDSDDFVIGSSGPRGNLPGAPLTAGELIAGEGIGAAVFRTGENVISNSATLPTGDLPDNTQPVTGSEMCIALKEGEQILGIIDVMSAQPNAFAINDLLAMESLAGVLSSVVSSANHYGRLQETIRQLRAAQIESQARLVAQQEAENRLVQGAKLVAVGEMAAGIAHELNNPLTTVTGFAELILDETPPDSQHRADLEMVLHEALRARGVVRRLLDFARQGERARANCDLNEIVDDVLALSKHFIHTSGVRLETSFAEDLPWVSVDANQMKQVFLNLIHNAVEAMPTGGNLSMRSEMRSKDGRNWATVAIHDSGIGISPKDIDRIFEPFYTTRGTRGGTGLGLSVTYGIVTDHGGTIEVESRPGEGSTFTVWLPY